MQTRENPLKEKSCVRGKHVTYTKNLKRKRKGQLSPRKKMRWKAWNFSFVTFTNFIILSQTLHLFLSRRPCRHDTPLVSFLRVTLLLPFLLFPLLLLLLFLLFLLVFPLFLLLLLVFPSFPLLLALLRPMFLLRALFLRLFIPLSLPPTLMYPFLLHTLVLFKPNSYVL